MNEQKYAHICPETVNRIYAEMASRYAKPKDADKAARARLHMIAGAFMADGALKKAGERMREYFDGDAGALNKALSLHASTRERLTSADELYDRAFKACAGASSILDLACGLNPIYLAARGVKGVLGIDIHLGCVELINECALIGGWNARARAGDILCALPDEECDLALMMKLLPVLEAQKPGAAIKALEGVKARRVLVSFPTRTLGGRGVGMLKHYESWFESRVPANMRVMDKYQAGSELVYLLERTPNG